MKAFIFLIFTYLMGFLAAIPFGATQIEIAKRSFNNKLSQAFMVVTGSACSDVMYGFIALFGLAPFLGNKEVVAIFELASAVILLPLAFLTVRDGKKGISSDINLIALESKKLSFLTGFSLAITNPLMIFWWLIGASLIKNFGLVTDYDLSNSLLFLLFGGLGIASYLILLANILHWAKKFISDKLLKKINIGLGVALLLLSFYFFAKSFHILFY
jgi:threonine/homoserine/homoserine lactone efflux protein